MQMFLKRIEMQGFKSFADRTVISFEQHVTGIVGPNGCGKSNITDAIRWVLGEQSAKSLRGSAMSDVIFAGSGQRKSVNLAEVTLVFDNTSHFLHSPYEEVEITRRLHRTTQEGEYLINRRQVRLKDIQDLILDSGLGRDSLTMISQGNISSFAEAKPIDRRAIFEEAAGVAKYKKKKIESLNKLERTQSNLERLQDIVAELERQVTPLKRAAKKALVYREKKERLRNIEIAVLVEEIRFFLDKQQECKKAKFDLQTQIASHQATITTGENQLTNLRVQISKLDDQIAVWQDDLMKTVNEIQHLENRKVEIDEKSKYRLQTGSEEEKLSELKRLMEQAKFEYEDRLARLQETETEINLSSAQLQQVTVDQIELSSQWEEKSGRIRSLENRYAVLESLLQRPFQNQAGVSAILNAKSTLPGVYDALANVIEPQPGYEEAISVALGGAMYNIVTEDDASARRAIGFLKKNQSGRATFLPLTSLTPRHVGREHEIIAKAADGYLGTADLFVRCDHQYQPVLDSLLGNVLVMSDLEKGNQLAQLLRHQYKIVTLEGDVIHRGGSMTGGRGKENNSPLTLRQEMEALQKDIKQQEADLEVFSRKREDLAHRRQQLESDLLNARLTNAKLEPVVEQKRHNYERYQSELGVSDQDEESFSDSLITKLSTAYKDKDQLSQMLSLKRQEREQIVKNRDSLEAGLRLARRELGEKSEQLKDVEVDIARVETKLEADANRLASEYQMTYEFASQLVADTKVENAKQEVEILRRQIEELGNINMSAPEEFEEINERYQFLSHQLEDLNDSREQLLAIIEEMDEVMKKDFSEMFEKINSVFQDTFSQLFGGGKARLVLEDPDDILNTGIDIDVQPPGKAIQNIRLFSGGEKTLIAISVLFSILKARIIPLCIFDEADSALDQGNVERFSRLLKHFAQTQFVVVTHRPGTMAQCDILYGITMPAQGVSQMLRVKLSQAEKLSGQPEVTA